VTGRRGMRVVVVVPAFAEGEQRDDDVVAGIVAGGEAAGAPQVGYRVYRPGGVQAEGEAHAGGPQQ